MSDSTLLGNDFRIGYMKPLKGSWRPVVYTVVNGLAIVDGCIILGTVQEVEQTAAVIRSNPALLTDGAQPFAAGIKGAQYRWEDKIIPYVISSQLPQPQRVLDAIQHWEEKTDFQFPSRDPAKHPNYVEFVPGEGCASSVGCIGGRQIVMLGSGCQKGNIIHEIGHTIGLWHEQSRIDRDEHIEIVWSKVQQAARHNFEQHLNDGVDLGDYDYGSIMHYPPSAFSTDGQATIKPRKALPPGVQMGQREALSGGDIQGVKDLYKP